MLESIRDTLNLCIQTEIQMRYKVEYLFEGCYFRAILGIEKIAKIKCL